MQEKLTNRIKKGVQLLEEQQGYNKADILRRLETIEQGISPASMSNIMNDKEVGLKILNRAIMFCRSTMKDIYPCKSIC